ncbi:rRNA maturation RNase YbeY [Glaciecola sp. 1036]|uniref:rRNA maturation RNase YbeY n=1 Tax=Alteromonadaceae TaxID=72275 RepID=UPI003CFFB706
MIINTSSLILEIQVADEISLKDGNLLQLNIQQLQQTLSCIPTILGLQDDVSAVIRITGREEAQSLNDQYRGKNYPTNVLSFPSDLPDFVESEHIGDLVICLDVVVEESKQQNKNLLHHFVHLCVHGILHLLGYDHIENEDAEEMESLEVKILAQLGIDDPYLLQ